MNKLIIILILQIVQTSTTADEIEVARANAWLAEFNQNASELIYEMRQLQWEYYTNVTVHNGEAMAEAVAEVTEWYDFKAAEADKLFDLDKLSSDPLTHRAVYFTSLNELNLTKEQTLVWMGVGANLTSGYNTPTICAWSSITRQPNCSEQWSLDPELTDRMARSRDYAELAYIWNEWRNVTKGMKALFKRNVDLENLGVRQGNAGFRDQGERWRSWYEIPDALFTAQLEEILHRLLPLYEQLHTYVRRQLRQKYRGNFETSAIPAHLLGNMWSQEWANLYDFTKPFPNKGSGLDVTEELVKQGYTPKRMFKMAEEFFTSIGLSPMPEKFWKYSMIEKPEGRDVVCHGSAWDFYAHNDVRIKMCTNINMEDMLTIHHEMGHVQYYLNQADLPLVFRSGANPGFHEAIGDTISLSVNTPKHMQEMGLLLNYEPDDELTLNYLFKQALDKVAFIPFGYLIDMWRWRVMDGSYAMEDWNDKWWQWRHKLQGIVPPSGRPADAFDPVSKYHVVQSVSYIRYFVSSILQFQFYKAMCDAAGHEGPLHECDFYRSTAAGDRMKAMLELGSSVKPPVAMKAITGQEDMSVEPLVEYFKPILDWLKKTNEAAADCYGWAVEWPAEVMQTLSQPRCGTLMYKFLEPQSEPQAEGPPESEAEVEAEPDTVKKERGETPKASSTTGFVVAVVVLAAICAILLVVSAILMKKSKSRKIVGSVTSKI